MDGGAINEGAYNSVIGLPYTIPQVGWLKQQKLVLSQF